MVFSWLRFALCELFSDAFGPWVGGSRILKVLPFRRALVEFKTDSGFKWRLRDLGVRLDGEGKQFGVQTWVRSLRGDILASPTTITPTQRVEANRKGNKERSHRWAALLLLSPAKNPLG